MIGDALLQERLGLPLRALWVPGGSPSTGGSPATGGDGILFDWTDGLVPGRSGGQIGPYDVWNVNAGPGQPLGTYLPKTDPCYDKLMRTLQHSMAPAVAGAIPLAAPPKGRGKGKNKEGPQRPYLRTKDKRLEKQYWTTGGQNHKGSHYPLCFFTNNVGRRSDGAFVARRQKSHHK